MTVAYLSRIWLNPWRRQTRRFFRDPHALHATVLAGLPAQPVDERVLWRLDDADVRVVAEASSQTPHSESAESSGHRIALYVVTRSSPSWEHLIEQAGWPSAYGGEPQAAVRRYDQLLDRLDVGEHYAFRLTANPTRSIRVPTTQEGTRPRGKRVAHVTARQQLDWLVGRTSQLGFQIPAPRVSGTGSYAEVDVRIVNRKVRNFTKGRRRSRRVTISSVTFDGRLIVDDPDRLRQALLDGIGSAKAYGCGLMTLAPVNP